MMKNNLITLHNSEWTPLLELPLVKDPTYLELATNIFNYVGIYDLSSIHSYNSLESLQSEECLDKAISVLLNSGKIIKDERFDFNELIPNYSAKVLVIDLKGSRFIYVKDFAGSYLYMSKRNQLSQSSILSNDE